jgi:WD40 repeat protein
MSTHPTTLALRTDDGGSVRLGRLLGSGGEAKIYEVLGATTLVAKLYHDDDPAHRATMLREKEAKVRAMLAHPPELSSRFSVIAWPRSALRRNGQFIGFLMPRAQGQILFRYHNPKERRKHSPNFDWRYLHRTAFNLSAIVDSIHRAGHVVADMNDQNFLVQDSALVSAVDTDSFQIHDDGARRWHLCTVGRPEFTPPELQGRSFAQHPRTAEQDRFGLAVLIFQLLMEGSHPFRARLNLPRSVPEAQLYCIQHGHFPYAPGPGNPASPPPTGLNFHLLHPLLQNLFRRCFVDGHTQPARRPTAGDWREALKSAEEELVTCPKGHKHRTGLPDCPWCLREQALKALPRAARAPRRIVVPGRSAPQVLRPRASVPVPPMPGMPRPVKNPPRRPIVYRTPIPSTTPELPLLARGLVFTVMMVLIAMSKCHPDPSPYNSKTGSINYTERLREMQEQFKSGRKMAEITSYNALPVEARVTIPHTTEVLAASFSPDSRWVLTVSRGRVVRILEAASGAPLGQLEHPGLVTSAAFSPDGRRIVTTCADHTARLWNTAVFAQIGQPLQHADAVAAAVFSPDNSRIVTACDNGKAQVWDAASGQASGQPMAHTGKILAVVFSPDGTKVATASADTTARIWNAGTGEPVTGSLSHRATVNTVNFSPNGRWLVTASDDDTARVWSVETGQLLGTPLMHFGEVRTAVFSPDGTLVATASSDTNARLWNPLGSRLDTQYKHSSEVRSASFSPDGRWLVTASDARASRIWNVENGAPVAELENGYQMTTASFSPDGRWLVTGGSDRSARVWVIPEVKRPSSWLPRTNGNGEAPALEPKK